MYYVKRLSSGIARISLDESEEYDFTFSDIPNIQDGVLMITISGELYFDGFTPIENDVKKPTDHEILMTLLGVTE